MSRFVNYSKLLRLKFLISISGILFFISFSSVYCQTPEYPNYERLTCLNYNSIIQDGNTVPFQSHLLEFNKTGSIRLSPISLEDIGGLSGLIDSLTIDSNSNFKLEKIKTLRCVNDKTIFTYQQFYQNIPVHGGGFSIIFDDEILERPSGPGPIDPCITFSLIRTNIFSEVDISTTPTKTNILIAQILGIPSSEIHVSDLSIYHHFKDSCDYNLGWRVDYTDSTGVNMISWIDDQSGGVLRSLKQGMYLNAPTEDYDQKMLDDKNTSGVVSLETPDQSIQTYDFGGTTDFYSAFRQMSPSDFSSTLIPVTTSSSWTTSVADKQVYQAHHVAVECNEALASVIGESFSNLNVGINYAEIISPGTAGVPLNFRSTYSEAYIMFGLDNGNTTAVYDICGHEFGHIVLYDLGLEYSTSFAQILHEGISDWIGVMIEKEIKGQVDWDMGSEIPKTDGRDLSNPLTSCFTLNWGLHPVVINTRPIGYMFYLLTQGGQLVSTPLGMDETLDFMLDIIEFIGPNPGFLEFIEASVMFIDDQFGICSDESLAIREAWDAIICESTNHPVDEFYEISELILNKFKDFEGCDFTITGSNTVCEESEYLNLCVSGGLSSAIYHWTIIGPKSTQFQSTLGMNGNSQTGGKCLELTDFPKYPYYPQYITVQVYSPNTPSEKNIVTKRIKIIDCNFLDPSCDDYYSEIELSSENNNRKLNSFKNPEFVIIYNLSGKMIYKGKASDFKVSDFEYLPIGIYIKVKFDYSHNFLGSTKLLLGDGRIFQR